MTQQHATTPVVTCPRCGRLTNDIKQLRIWRSFICVIVFIRWREEVVVACPDCMRKELTQSLLDNIISANLAWPAMAILYIPRYLTTRRAGPSLLPIRANPLLHDVSARPTASSGLKSVAAALIIVAGIVGLSLAVDRHGPGSENAVGWVCVAVSVGMFVALIRMGSRSRRRGG